MSVRSMTRTRTDETPSLAGRLVGAVLASSFTVLTVLVIPLLLSWKFPLKGRYLFPVLTGWGLNMFLFWLGLVAIVAMIVGFVHGFWGVLDIFNLVWRTGESYEPETMDAAMFFRKLILVSVCVPIVIIVVSRL